MAKRVRTGQAATSHGKWRYKRPNFDTLQESAEWGNKAYSSAAEMAAAAKSGKCYGYTRVSTEEQAGHGFSLSAQADQIFAHFENRVSKKHPHLTWGEMIVDPGESAFRKKFLQRPGGARLNSMLQRGDHIIFSCMDRAFRLGADYFQMSEIWTSRGVIVHYIDPDVDGSTALGWGWLANQAVSAELFSRYLSEKTKAGIRKRKEMGYMYHKNHPDVGKCCVYSRSRNMMVEVPADTQYWDKLAKAAELLNEHGATVAAGLFNDWLHRDDPNYKRPVASRYEYSREKILRMAARHVGITARDRKVSPHEIREKYREMQAATAGSDTEPSDSASQ